MVLFFRNALIHEQSHIMKYCRFLPLVIQIFKDVSTVRTALGNQICLVLYRFVQVVLLLVWVHCVHSR